MPLGARINADINANRTLISYDVNAVSGTIIVNASNSCGVGVSKSIPINLIPFDKSLKSKLNDGSARFSNDDTFIAFA